MKRRAVASVIGSNTASAHVLDQAEALGRALVDTDFRVLTGGLGGVMEAASRGARSSEAWSEGRVVGLLPGLDASAANSFVDIAIPTGLNYARNVLVVSSADVVIAVAGSCGTLSELALAWQHGKPIVVLDVGEGWSSRLAGEALDNRRDDVLHRATTPAEAARLARGLVGSREAPRGF